MEDKVVEQGKSGKITLWQYSENSKKTTFLDINQSRNRRLEI
jgi:hypothetical protein